MRLKSTSQPTPAEPSLIYSNDIAIPKRIPSPLSGNFKISTHTSTETPWTLKLITIRKRSSWGTQSPDPLLESSDGNWGSNNMILQSFTELVQESSPTTPHDTRNLVYLTRTPWLKITSPLLVKMQNQTIWHCKKSKRLNTKTPPLKR